MRPSEKFVWGQITQEWEIGPYHIAAYHPKLPSNKGKGVDETQTNYHIWVDGRDTHTSSLTLEGAMIIAIADKSLGRHPEGLSMIARALNLPEGKP